MHDQVAPQISELVQAALDQKSLSGISEILRRVAEAMNAFGCILWQVDPEIDLENAPPNARMFVIAEWFPDDQSAAIHDLLLFHSLSGDAVLNNKTINVPDISVNNRVYKAKFLYRTGIKSFCTIPISYRDGVIGAFNLYRTSSSSFDEKEVEQAKYFAAVLPALYEVIRNEVSLNLAKAMDELLLNVEPYMPGSPFTKPLTQPYEEQLKQKVKKVLQEICELVSKSFGCLETSVFLEDRLKSPGVYELEATNWSGPFTHSEYRRKDKGLTGWVLTHSKPIKIPNLANFIRDREVYRHRYRGITWADSLDIKNNLPETLRIKYEGGLPPLSFMAAPIVNGNSTCGVIRCCGSSKGSYYFGSPELNLLTLVASQISRVWNDFMAILEENSAWHNMFKSIKELNAFVYRELKPGNPSIQAIFEEGLRIGQSVIDGAEILDVRLIKENGLEFVAKYGKAWDEGSPAELVARSKKTFDLNVQPPKSVGAYVIQTGQPYVVEEVRSDPYYDETFRQATGMIVVPIPGTFKDNKATGVLDIRKTNGRPFTRNAIYMAALLGQQFGIYQSMDDILLELRKAKNRIADQLKELKTLQDQQERSARDQVRIARDLQHQFKTPITQAHARVQDLLDYTDDEDIKSQIRLVRGLCGKAKRVSNSTRLFSDLALDNPIVVKPTELNFDALVKILKEANMDIQLMVPSRRRITFWVDEESFKVAMKNKMLSVDKDLLDQMLSDVLDNAAKYSHPNTTVRVSAGWTGTNRFYISVLNKGLTIKKEEVPLCVQRAWQSEEAKAVSGMESGIGLYIVHEVMKAHDGHLHILPTTSEHYTEVRLMFPDSKVK